MWEPALPLGGECARGVTAIWDVFYQVHLLNSRQVSCMAARRDGGTRGVGAADQPRTISPWLDSGVFSIFIRILRRVVVPRGKAEYRSRRYLNPEILRIPEHTIEKISIPINQLRVQVESVQVRRYASTADQPRKDIRRVRFAVKDFPFGKSRGLQGYNVVPRKGFSLSRS